MDLKCHKVLIFMKYKEYGKNNKKTIVLLHGGGLSDWNYKRAAVLLENEYHVILPVLDGHGGSDKGFNGIKENAKEVEQFISNCCDGHVLAIGGLSLGGQIALEIMSVNSDICDFGIIESASLVPNDFLSIFIKPAFMMSYPLIKNRMFAWLQIRSLHINKELFDDYYCDTCLISKKDLIGFTIDSLRYRANEDLNKSKAKILMLYGSKELRNIKKSANVLLELKKDSVSKEIKGLYHGELSLNKPEEYAKILNSFVKTGV